jgi:hypothetical protein
MAELNTVKGTERTKLRKLFKVFPFQESFSVSDPQINADPDLDY